LGAAEESAAPRWLGESALVCAELERYIERAECDEGGKEEYSTESDEEDAERPGHDAAKIQIAKQGGDDDTKDAINIGHVAFHDWTPFCGCKSISLMSIE
jgi:hypothetical protein